MTTSLISPRRRQGAEEYSPFGNVQMRNDLQARIEVPLMCWALNLPLGGRILEVGCGRGVALPVLTERLNPHSVTGLDIDPALVAIARSAGVAPVIEGDVRHLPFDDASFDLVVDFGTCYHVSGGTAGAKMAICEISRVLAPNGLFVHETPIAQHLAHPVRSFGKQIPWAREAGFTLERAAFLWSRRRKVAPCAR